MPELLFFAVTLVQKIEIIMNGRTNARVFIAGVGLLGIFLASANAQTPITYLKSWGTPGSGDSQFAQPSGLAVGPTGNVYIADTWNNRVQEFNSNGGFITKWGSSGSGDGQFSAPLGMAVSSTGTVYVADSDNYRVQKFTASGGFITKWGYQGSTINTFDKPCGLAVGDGDSGVYVTETINHRLKEFTSSGGLEEIWSGVFGPFNWPYGIAISPSGEIYVVDSAISLVEKMDSNGAAELSWGGHGPWNGQFIGPTCVAINANSEVYVADSGNNRIQIFNRFGEYETKFGSFGSGDGQFNSPQGMAINPTGEIYVADSGNNRIEKWFELDAWVSGMPHLDMAAVGAGQLLGQTLTLGPTRGLNIDGALTVLSGGSLSQQGGNITAGTISNDGSMIINSGTLSATSWEHIGESGTGTLNQSAGTNTLGSLVLGVNSSGNGTYILSGTGQLSTYDEFLGIFGAGAVQQHGGNNHLDGNLYLGWNPNSSGTYTLDGPGQLSAQYEDVGMSSNSTFYHSAGTNTVVHGLTLGYAETVTGTYNLGDTGQLSATDYEKIGLDGIGVFNQSGGTNTVIGSLKLAANPTGNGTYNLTGGTLILNDLQKGDGTAIFNFGGGTMRATNSFTTDVPITLTSINGNASIDTQNNNVTISSPVSGSGGLDKNGAGILTLSALISYSGHTTVNSGTLEIAGGIGPSGTSLIDVQSGTATLKTTPINKSNLNINTAALATFEVVNGAHVVGAISGSGITKVDDGASLTTASINQGTLTLGIGATVTIQPIPGGPQGGAITPVPEPNDFVLLGAALVMLWYAWAKKVK